MFYHVFYQIFSAKFSFLNVFQYQTFRAMAAFLFTFAFVIILQPIFIRKLAALGVRGQPIRDDGPKDHETKRGTPTMGGLIVIAAIFVAALLFCDLTNRYVWLILGVMLCYAYLGFIDDWRKITKQDSKGLSEREKLISQIVIAGVAGSILWGTQFPHFLTVPFLKTVMIPLGVLFVLLVIIVVIGTSNAVNLTDGLDGLAIGPVMTVAATYALIAYCTGHYKIAQYLHLTHISGMGEISVVLAAVFAGGLGFLWYNTFPAQIFMGDTGALALGGVLGFAAVLVKQELLLVIAGGIFVVEALSVIIQRYYYKLTKKRVFRMAPIHHHYELKGWAEPKIIVRFWIISIVLAILSLATLKLR